MSIELDELVQARRMEKTEPDREQAEGRWRNAAHANARAIAILEEERSQANARIACLLTWDAALDVSHGWLALFGYRVTSERGHHVAAIQALKALFAGRREMLGLMRQVDGLRRLRDSTLYNNEPVDPEDIQPYLRHVEGLADLLGKAVLRA